MVVTDRAITMVVTSDAPAVNRKAVPWTKHQAGAEPSVK
jgi:hypothetical protein